MEKVLSKIERYILYATAVAFPLSFFYISPNPYVISKLAVLITGISLFFLVRSIRIIITGKLEFVSGTFDFAALLLLLAYTASAYFRTPNKMEAFLLPGTASIFILGALFYFAINQLDRPAKRLASLFIVASGALVSVITILVFTGASSKMSFLPSFVRVKGFTPEGGFLPTAILLGALIPLSMSFVFSNVKKLKLTGIIASLLIVGGLFVSIFNILPGKQFAPRFLTYGDSWNITVDSMKSSPLLGMGPGNYLTAFNRFRPISYNSSDLWAVKFSTARSGMMTVATEAGILGVLGFVVLLFGIYKTSVSMKKKLSGEWLAQNGSMLSLILIAVSIMFFPTTLSHIIALFFLMAVVSKEKEFSVSLTGQRAGDDEVKATLAAKLPAFIVTLPIIAGVIYTDVKAANAFIAENSFRKSIDALSKNEASNTYDTMRSAVSKNPRVDRYRVTFSRVNLVLANAIAAKKDITDTDRQNIATLIQQSISEAKAAVALNPLRSGNWEALAQVYRAVSPLAKGADDFAIQSLRQAIVLDPSNPQLRVGLGGMYFAKGDFENAVRVFEMAVAAKPDHANARYNLAVALEKAGKIDQAISQMTLVVSLVKPDTKDSEVAKKALSDLQAKKTAQAGTGDELTPPQNAQEQILKPPLELPEGSEPPASPEQTTGQEEQNPQEQPGNSPTPVQ